MTRKSVMRYFVSLFLGVVLSSCTSTTATKPDGTSSSTPAPQAQPGKPFLPARQSTSSSPSTSSLDAHREGTAPANGPMKEIYFGFDKYDLRADARTALQINAAWLKANPAQNVEIEGHCDERGTTEYNLALGAKRARAARDYLVSLGIAPARITTVSYGEELLVCKETTEECYQRNRRDRFAVVRQRPAS